MLAILRAARDAHRSECLLDELQCDGCRASAASVAEAVVAQQRDPFEDFDVYEDAWHVPFFGTMEPSR
jgi:hypothetical protein